MDIIKYKYLKIVLESILINEGKHFPVLVRLKSHLNGTQCKHSPNEQGVACHQIIRQLLPTVDIVC